MDDCLERCSDFKVEIAALELSMGQEEAEVCLRYILMHARRRSGKIFEIFDTNEKMTIWWQAGRVGWSTKEREGALQERWQHDWQDMKYEGIVVKAPPCPERRVRTPMPQQSPSSTREEESQ